MDAGLVARLLEDLVPPVGDPVHLACSAAAGGVENERERLAGLSGLQQPDRTRREVFDRAGEPTLALVDHVAAGPRRRAEAEAAVDGALAGEEHDELVTALVGALEQTAYRAR